MSEVELRVNVATEDSLLVYLGVLAGIYSCWLLYLLDYSQSPKNTKDKEEVIADYERFANG